MPGYKSVKHQGWFDMKHKRSILQVTGESSPYPKGSSAHNEYMSGVNAFARGEHWEPPRSKRAYKAQNGRNAA